MEGTLVCTNAGTTGVVVEYNLISPRKIRDQGFSDLTVEKHNLQGCTVLYVKYVHTVLYVLFVFCVLCVFYTRDTMTAFPDRPEPDHDLVTPGHRPPH